MIKRTILAKINKWVDSKKILILNGARQVGKTTLLKEIKADLEKKGKNCTFINLEAFHVADRLNENPDNIFEFIDDKSAYNYVFLDEIQILDDPSRFLKYLYDTYDNLKLIISGSANLEIKAKLQDSLAGRKISFYVGPFSIDEILDHENINKQSDSPLVQKKLKTALDEYLVYGGMPDVYLEKNKEKKQTLLSEYIGTYVNKDIRSLVSELNISKFNKLNIVLANIIGNLVNKNEISNNVDLDNRTLGKYLDLLNYSFIFDFLAPYFSNAGTQIKKMPKVFCFDLGVRNAILNNFNHPDRRDDAGRLFENFVYLKLKNRVRQLYFWRTLQGAEADFVYREDGLNIIEAKYAEYSEPKIESSIYQAAEKLGPRSLKVVNLNLKESVKKGDLTVDFVRWNDEW